MGENSSARFTERTGDGFTLIEVLVGLTLLALVSAVLASSIFLGVGALNKTRVRADAVQSVHNAQQALRSLLERAQPLFDNDKVKKTVRFWGRETELIFLVDQPGSIGAHGLFELLIARQRTPENGGILVKLRRALAGQSAQQPEDQPWSETLLIDGVETLSFRYYGEQENEPGAFWRESWENQATLPSLIEIRVTFVKGDRRSWPGLFVAPRLDRVNWL